MPLSIASLPPPREGVHHDQIRQCRCREESAMIAAGHTLAFRTGKGAVVADEMRRGRCNVQRLTLGFVALEMEISEATEAVKALASAIRLDEKLEHLTLEVDIGFTDEAGLALAEALTVNNFFPQSHLVPLILPSIWSAIKLSTRGR
jgi:hypothetical protein